MLISSAMFLNLSVLMSRVSSHLTTTSVTTAYTYLCETQNCSEISNVLACRRTLKSMKAKNRYLMQEFLILREHFLMKGKKTQCATLHGNYTVLKYWKSTQEELKLQG